MVAFRVSNRTALENRRAERCFNYVLIVALRDNIVFRTRQQMPRTKVEEKLGVSTRLTEAKDTADFIGVPYL